MKNTGGPAFPRNILEHGHGVTTTHESGMTLRDYFAAKAMQALFAGAVMDGLTTDQDIDCDKLAMVTYTMADAMLKAREA